MARRAKGPMGAYNIKLAAIEAAEKAQEINEGKVLVQMDYRTSIMVTEKEAQRIYAKRERDGFILRQYRKVAK